MKTLKAAYSHLVSAIVLVVLLFAALALSAPAMAAAEPCGDNCSSNGGPSGNTAAASSPSKSSTSTDNCKNTTTNGNVDQSKVQKCLTQSPIVHDIQTIVNWLSAGVGIIVVGVIILGGIQYIMAGDNATALGNAKQRIINGMIALFLFLFAFGFLQWLIPGGVFK